MAVIKRRQRQKEKAMEKTQNREIETNHKTNEIRNCEPKHHTHIDNKKVATSLNNHF